MLFNSLTYLFFFPVVVIIYFLLPTVKIRIIGLLIASYIFYMAWNPVYIVLILISTIVDFIVGQKIHHTEDTRKRWALLGISVFINIGILFYFKYYNFLTESIEGFFSLFGFEMDIPQHSWLLPVGISFYTFQTLSYTIDIYRKKAKPEYNFLNFALYVTFFPQLVAGPIERPSNLLPQFQIKHKFEYKRVTDGLKLMGIGFFKKVVVADRISLIVNEVFNNPNQYWGYSVWIASFFFVFQLFCDFSGYTDIARGSARVMGFNLIENFTGPLYSKNVTELWRRWHISLSSWIRDYVFTPLGLALRDWGKYSFVLVMMITFILFGIWHGANWTFVFFGFLQGVALIYEALSKKQRKRWRKSTNTYLYKGISFCLTFLFWMYSCLIFRANDMFEVRQLTNNAFAFPDSFADSVVFKSEAFTINFYISLIAAAIVLIIHNIEYKGDIIEYLNKRHTGVRWSVYVCLLVAILALGDYGYNSEFIYFEF